MRAQPPTQTDSEAFCFTAGDLAALPVLFSYADLRLKLGLPWHRVTIWQMVRQGRFPAPRRLSARRKVWHRDDLLAWRASYEPIEGTKRAATATPTTSPSTVRAPRRRSGR